MALASYTAASNLGLLGVSRSNAARWILIGVGTQLTAMVVTGFVLGYALDVWIDSKPIFMLIFGGLGFVGGILKVYKLLIKLG
mgnify:CR=1 FL=1